MDKKLKNYCIFVLRKASLRWGPRSEALKRARVGRNQYQCAICRGIFPSKEKQLDHVEPMIRLDSNQYDMSLDEIAERLFAPVDKWQVLCISGKSGGCHGVKSQLESLLRAENRATIKEEKLNLKELEGEDDEE